MTTPPVLPTYGGSGLRPGVDLEDVDALEDVMGACEGYPAVAHPHRARPAPAEPVR